jgi:hypothetical protein
MIYQKKKFLYIEKKKISSEIIYLSIKGNSNEILY